MTLGPLEYMAIGVQDDRGMDEIVPALQAIDETGALRVLDLLVVRTDVAGAVTIQEVSAPETDNGSGATSATDRVPGLLTAEDVQALATALPADATAVVVLLEHLWAGTLTEAVQRAGGVLYTGGLIPPDALAHLEAGATAVATALTP